MENLPVEVQTGLGHLSSGQWWEGEEHERDQLWLVPRGSESRGAQWGAVPEGDPPTPAMFLTLIPAELGLML